MNSTSAETSAARLAQKAAWARRLRRIAILLALGSVAVSRWRARQAERSLAKDFPPIGRFIDLDDGSRIHLLESGETTAPVVVLIHGSDGVLDCFAHTLVEDLSRDMRVVAVDRPGHGWSTVDKHTIVGLESNVELLREALQKADVHRAVFVGHSYGAAVALRWALDHPEDVAGLVLLAPAAYFAWSRAQTALMHAPNVPVVGPALSRLLLPVLGPPALTLIASGISFRRDPVPPAFKQISKAFYLRPSQFSAFSHEYAHFRRDVAAIDKRYSQIDMPTWILVGADDPITRPERQAVRLAKEIPNARLSVLPRLAHEMQWYASEPILRAIRQVVAETWR